MVAAAHAPRVDVALARGGVLVLVLAIAWNVALDARTLLGGVPLDDITAQRAPVLVAIRAAFLLLAGACALELRRGMPSAWRAPVRTAGIVIAASVLGDMLGVLATLGALPDLTWSLGDTDDVHRRLFRLGAMAARAVPLLVLLAACEHARAAPVTPAPSSRAADLVVRFEPLVFAVGAGTLALLLVLSALVHKEIAWALPIGSDTTLAGCAAAAIRARRRTDTVAFAAWLTVALSMGAGLLMGLYAFGGPLPEPAAIGAYGALPRVLLRDAHVLTVAFSITLLGVAWLRTPGRSA